MEIPGQFSVEINTLPQGVRVNRLAEVICIGNVFRFLRSGREADLCRAGKVIEDFAPRRIRSGAASMALINDDQIKKARRELTIKLLPFLRSRDRLIKPKVDFKGGVYAALIITRKRKIDLGAILPLDGLGTKNRMRFLTPAFQRRQMIWKAVRVFPLPVAITKKIRFWPLAMASIERFTAVT